jgi:hypothetical protein
LAPVAEHAKRHGEKLFSESVDRFIRSPEYHSTDNPDAQADYADLQDLAFWADGVTLVTDLHPDASPHKVRSYQRKRGQKFKGNRGGRPTKRKWKERRLAWIHLARKMREAGQSFRQIAESLNGRKDGFSKVTHMTVRNWLERGV